MNRRRFLATLAASGVAAATHRGWAAQSEPAMTGSDPMAAAVRLSEMESFNYIPPLYELYGYMHPDAQAIVPRATVIGWYQADFQPRGPQPAVATGVTTLDSWTWPVNGVAYADVAEVSYTQRFDDGSTVNDVVRLVYHQGTWRWFFGRDKAWVQEQNARFNVLLSTPEFGDAPFGLSALQNLDERLLQRLPPEISDSEFATRYTLAATTTPPFPDGLLLATTRLRYDAVEPRSEFALGFVEHGAIKSPKSEVENLKALAELRRNAPPFELLGWNTAPAKGPSWLQYMNPGVDVVGPSYSVVVVSDATYMQVMMYSEESLQTVCEALAGPQ